jgi:cell wall-associated NlpC family hydrolase
MSVSLLFFAARVSASDPVDVAASLIGRPYVWGAEGPRAFDCSGLTQYVYQQFGIDLPRRAVSQSRAGDPAGRRLRRGDLLFFASDRRRSLVTHVGIYEGGGTMIDASQRYGKVRRSSLADSYWDERFMFARRVTDGNAAEERSIQVKRRQEPRSERRETAARVIGHLADVLIRRAIR